MATPCRHGYTTSSTMENKKLSESPVCVCVCLCVSQLDLCSQSVLFCLRGGNDIRAALSAENRDRERNCEARHVFISLSALIVNKQTQLSICLSVCLSVLLSFFLSFCLSSQSVCLSLFVMYRELYRCDLLT